jgi:hypothetical protein
MIDKKDDKWSVVRASMNREPEGWKALIGILETEKHRLHEELVTCKEDINLRWRQGRSQEIYMLISDIKEALNGK